MRSHDGDVRGTGRAGGSPDFPSAWGNCYTRRVTEISLPIVAHGFGEALPVPLPLALLATGAVTLGVAWRLGAPGASPPAHGLRPLPAAFTRFLDSPVTRGAARAAGLALFALILVIGAFGMDDRARNPAPLLLGSLLWVGLLAGSLLLGPVWRVANPLRALTAGMARLAGDPKHDAVRPLPDGIGVWPAAGALLVFLWWELVAVGEPLGTVVFLSAYIAVQVGAATVYGPRWYARGDGFEVYSTMLGRLAPVRRGPDGRFVWGGPRAGIATAPAPTGTTAVVAVLIGAHVFDGLLATAVGEAVTGGVVPGTAMLLACMAAVYGLVTGAVRGREHLAAAFVPVVAGHAIAHYAGPVLVDLQVLVRQMSDPLRRGWDLFGTAGTAVRSDVAESPVAGVVAVVAVVAGYALGLATAHDRAAGGRPADVVAIRALLVVGAIAGVALQFGTGGHG